MINSKTIQYPFTEDDMMRLTEYNDDLPLYVGRAAPGTPTSVPGWQIRKFTYDASNNETAMQFAGGANDYNQIWDSRALLSYS